MFLSFLVLSECGSLYSALCAVILFVGLTYPVFLYFFPILSNIHLSSYLFATFSVAIIAKTELLILSFVFTIYQLYIIVIHISLNDFRTCISYVGVTLDCSLVSSTISSISEVPYINGLCLYF